MTTDPILRLTGVSKDYNALRPLRVAHLELAPADTVALLGFDRAAAEVLVNMITAATLPDAGDVTIFGTSTRDITNVEQWFAILDRFGILSERMVLIDELTVGQNLALPLSMEVETLSEDIRDRVAALTEEAGVTAIDAARPMATAGAATKLRTRLGKALALKPDVLLVEHASATLSDAEAAELAGDLASIAERRSLAMLVLTADSSFASTACRRVLTLKPATGELAPVSSWRRWFSRS